MAEVLGFSLAALTVRTLQGLVAESVQSYIRCQHQYILDSVAKHLIDIDEEALDAARVQLGTTTIKDTVNAALRRATCQREEQVAAALDVLAAAQLDDRTDAWR